MGNLVAVSEQVGFTSAGLGHGPQVLRHLSSGFRGQQMRADMVVYLDSVLDAGAAAILFDFRSLDYSFGDAIGGLAVALVRRGPGLHPSAIVATGQTAAH